MINVSNSSVLQNEKVSSEYKSLLKQSLLGSIQKGVIHVPDGQLYSNSEPVFSVCGKSAFCFYINNIKSIGVKGLKNSHWLK